ncbi:type IV conjugative transfer system coupling protein TraD [Rahnella inusitata]|nr:type IV conjugative transfer system coupling protein TraD [Rahnella inusitata]
MDKSKRENSSVKELNRGGQTLIHFLRMLHQTLKRYFKVVLSIYTISSVVLGYWLTSPLDRYMGFKYYFSKLQVDYLNLKESNANLTLPDGRIVSVTNQAIVNSSSMQRNADTLYNNVILGAGIAGCIALLAAILIYRYLVNRGKNEGQDKHLRGTELTEDVTLRKLAELEVLESRKPSRISLSGIPLPRGQENSGIVLSGSPGVGKSTAIRDILRQLRAQNKKAVIYDIGGEFVRKFYRPGIDVILDCFDARSHSWDVWCEGRHEMDYDRHSKAAIPEAHDGDPFWILSAQLLFSSIAQQLGERHEVPEMEHLMNIILRMSADQIAHVVADTDARNVINVDADKLASSVRAIITAYTRNLKYFAKCKGPRFSFKEWANNDDDRSFVFITVRDDMKAALKSPLTMLIEAALSAILSLKPDNERMIGVVIDEIKTLNALPSIPDFAATGRKYGGMLTIGMQSPSQIYQMFGEEGAKGLFDIMGTFAAFRINGIDGAKWSARQLGDQEIESANENTSFGANDVRDAVSVNHSLKEGDLLLASQITKLKDLECYLRLNRGMPVSKIRYQPDNMKDVAEGIVEADFLVKSETKYNFSLENTNSPEEVVSAIFKDAKRNNISDVKSWEGNKQSGLNRPPLPSDKSATNHSEDETNESSGEGISGGIDLMALANERAERSQSSSPSTTQPKNSDKGPGPELDIGF